MLVFDLDDTLYLERDFAFSGYRFLDSLLTARFGTTGFEAVCRELLDSGEKRVIDRALERIGMSGESELSSELIAAYREHSPDISLLPDSVRCLQRHRNREPLGLITDGLQRTQAAKVKALGLEKIIAHICLTGSLGPGRGKPHPEAYRLMERLGGPSTSYCYVADNPAKDFVTPKAMGWTTVQIIRLGAIHSPEAPDEDHAAHFKIESLDQLDALLAK